MISQILNEKVIQQENNNFMRSATLAIKKAEKTKKEKKIHMKKIHIKEKELEDTIIMLITTGEANKLADLLNKVNINLEFKDLDGNTPFNIAAQNGYYDILNILLKNGAYIDTQNNLGNTPLHFAHTYNFPNVLNLLIANGANQTILNNRGNSPWEGI